MGRTRIPDNVAGFDGYMKITGAYLFKADASTGQANWQRLGLSSAEANLWLAKCNSWNNSLFPRYSNIGTRTIPVTLEARMFRKDFSKTCNCIVRRIAASANATVVDEIVFRFSRAINTGRRRFAPIKDFCIAKVIPLSGCMYLIKCSTTTNGKSKKPASADSILMHYKIVDCESLSASELIVDKTWNTKQLPNARQIFQAGTDNKGKVLLAAFQWNYSRKPWLAGPLSEIYSKIIV